MKFGLSWYATSHYHQIEPAQKSTTNMKREYANQSNKCVKANGSLILTVILSGWVSFGGGDETVHHTVTATTGQQLRISKPLTTRKLSAHENTISGGTKY